MELSAYHKHMSQQYLGLFLFWVADVRLLLSGAVRFTTHTKGKRAARAALFFFGSVGSPQRFRLHVAAVSANNLRRYALGSR
jgi:hypothetical protein